MDCGRKFYRELHRFVFGTAESFRLLFDEHSAAQLAGFPWPLFRA
jgi:hypothetical protein